MDQEIEAKFYLQNLAAFRQRLMAAGARLIQPCVQETNLRFDTPQLDLRQKAQVLRLRQDEAAHLTFKGPGALEGGVLARQEIEFEVSDFAAARRFLEALGYRVYTTYEKSRETYVLAGVKISLDEMPFGTFTELEGPSPQVIHQLAESLNLAWERRITTSYLELFAQLKVRLALPFDDLTFEAFRELTIRPEDLGVQPADKY
jgi:adenylate cyclase class 2